MATNKQWFEALAGEAHGQGLRDIMVHRRGTYQLGWTESDEANSFEFRPAMVSDSGFVSDNLLPELKEIIEGYFLYLDQTFDHFVKKMRKTLGDHTLLANSVSTQYIQFPSKDPPASFWIYPNITK